METTVYLIWGILPSVFLLMALWGWLEGLGSSAKKRTDEVQDLLRQGAFILCCVVVTYGLYRFVVAPYLNPIIEPYVPPFLVQLLLLPLVLYLGALIAGPSKDIKISKAPYPTKRRRG